MAKPQKSYTCQSCGSISTRWAGKCESCNEWNTIQEEVATNTVPKGLSGKHKGRIIDFVDLRHSNKKTYPRHKTKIAEFDRVTGGGLVPGSAILIGGDPGIGKSTLLLQAVCALTKNNVHCVYISGEESIDQIRMRANRLGLGDTGVMLASATNVRDILESVKSSPETVQLLVIDSIQTMYVDSVDSAPGTVTQVRTSTQEIIRMAKSRNIVVVFVGHVTKDGQIAGPRVLEHLVDTVLYFEGDRSHQFRILRTVKNRFGPTDEIGVFEMAEQGLIEVANPSALFLSQRHEGAAGSAVLAALEGTRPLLVEVQALVVASSLGTPRRSVLGWDQNRLAMIVAVLESRCGISLSSHDIFLNIAGGIRINEPAADLAVAAALISALANEALPADTIFFGEIGLAGEVRQVSQPELRLKESSKLGFERATIPKLSKKTAKKNSDILSKEITHVKELASLLGVSVDEQE
ncbi:MAG: DNA repair protein RadA [Zetaproteobacteria bacterium]|nr:MAG: DNA repair protein RadA [Zetaproteobacteria bacterium]